jgi:hypothetical protein
MMRNKLLDDAIAMIRSAGYEPKVVCNRHWKISWVDGSGRKCCLVISVSPSDRLAHHRSRTELRKLLAIENRTRR